MMTMRDSGDTGGAEIAVMAAAIAAAQSVTGGIVRLEPRQFQKILSRGESLVVVQATGGVFTKHFRYLTNYKGIFFFTKSKERLSLGHKVELVAAQSIWIPSQM